MPITIPFVKTLLAIFLKGTLVLSLSLISFASSSAKWTGEASSGAILTSVTDSLGNVNTNSYKDLDLSWSCYPNCPDLSLNIGETIMITALGSDPYNLPLEYQFWIQVNGSGGIVQDWSANNQFVWHISEEYYGRWILVLVSVRNNDGIDELDSFGDDYTYASYEVISPGHPYTNLSSIVDSLGNVNTNSINKGNLKWSCAPNCPRLTVQPGEKITISAFAANDQTGPFEYVFYIVDSDGLIFVIRDWGLDNTYPWTVPCNRINQNVTILIGVRNSDGLNYNSDFGDDYTEATYHVTGNCIHLPIIRKN